MNSMLVNILLKILLIAPGLLLGVIVHELAHGYIAYKFGDPTPKLAGRLSFDPMVHLDPIYSLLIPLMLIALNSNVIFGMAKPVPINPNNFKDYKRGIRYVSLAGPISNLIIAFLAGNLLGILVFISKTYMPTLMYNSIFIGINNIINYAININIFLAFFNLLPIPPLDGSKVLASFMSYQNMQKFLALEQYGIYIIFLFIYFAGSLLWKIIDPLQRVFTEICLWWRIFL
ncbi:MAG: site-2 protease family protein [Actinobacteria bacterium]|nr:site-2 protease family protein [Actinomycetota bacterium]